MRPRRQRCGDVLEAGYEGPGVFGGELGGWGSPGESFESATDPGLDSAIHLPIAEAASGSVRTTAW